MFLLGIRSGDSHLSRVWNGGQGISKSKYFVRLIT